MLQKRGYICASALLFSSLSCCSGFVVGSSEWHPIMLSCLKHRVSVIIVCQNQEDTEINLRSAWVGLGKGLDCRRIVTQQAGPVPQFDIP
jgi:hypothetical protein